LGDMDLVDGEFVRLWQNGSDIELYHILGDAEDASNVIVTINGEEFELKEVTLAKEDEWTVTSVADGRDVLWTFANSETEATVTIRYMVEIGLWFESISEGGTVEFASDYDDGRSVVFTGDGEDVFANENTTPWTADFMAIGTSVADGTAQVRLIPDAGYTVKSFSISTDDEAELKFNAAAGYWYVEIKDTDSVRHVVSVEFAKMEVEATLVNAAAGEFLRLNQIGDIDSRVFELYHVLGEAEDAGNIRLTFNGVTLPLAVTEVRFAPSVGGWIVTSAPIDCVIPGTAWTFTRGESTYTINYYVEVGLRFGSINAGGVVRFVSEGSVIEFRGNGTDVFVGGNATAWTAPFMPFGTSMENSASPVRLEIEVTAADTMIRSVTVNRNGTQETIPTRPYNGVFEFELDEDGDWESVMYTVTVTFGIDPGIMEIDEEDHVRVPATIHRAGVAGAAGVLTPDDLLGLINAQVERENDALPEDADCYDFQQRWEYYEDGNFWLNLTTELIEIPLIYRGDCAEECTETAHHADCTFEIRPIIEAEGFTVDGNRWRPVVARTFEHRNGMLPLLNRATTMSIASNFPTRAREPVAFVNYAAQVGTAADGDTPASANFAAEVEEVFSIVVSFAPTAARPRPRPVINYAMFADNTGLTNGRWGFASERGVMVSTGTTNITTRFDILALAPNGRRITDVDTSINNGQWGRIGATGIAIGDLGAGDRVVRTRYFIRLAAAVTGTGTNTVYTPASAARAIQASSVLRAPAAPRLINRAGRAVRFRAGQAIEFGVLSGTVTAGTAITGLTNARLFAAGGEITFATTNNSSTYRLWTVATDRRPASAKSAFSPAIAIP